MVKPFGRSTIGATFFGKVAFFVFFVGFLSAIHAETAWFNAKGPVGDTTREFSVVVIMDSVPVFKGSGRLAPAVISGQTLMADRVTLDAHYSSSDTAFSWSAVVLSKRTSTPSPLPDPIWSNTVRSGRGENDWTRGTFAKGSSKIEFHSPIYGDGVHELKELALPEELLLPIAVRLMQNPSEVRFRIMDSQWEMPYVRRQSVVRGWVTASRLKIDEVEAAQVRFEREDGAIAEAWVTTQGFRVLRFRTFRGLWLERIQ
jgi:hypothetical protein